MQFCDELTILIGVNSSKKTLFTESERINLILQTLQDQTDFKTHRLFTNNNIKVATYGGLIVNYAKEIEANILIRGIRSVSDFEYEINLAGVNKTLSSDIETVFLPTSPELAVVSSSMVKEIAKYQGYIGRFVSSSVAKAVYDKLNNTAK